MDTGRDMMPSDAAVMEPDVRRVRPAARLDAVVPGVPIAQRAGDAPAAADDVALRMRLEGILFVADRPVTVAELAQALEATRDAVERVLSDLDDACRARGVRLQRSGGHVQMVSAPEAADAIQRFLGLEASARLSRAALECLSIIAYRQPLTRPEIDALRGVNSDGVLRTLLARGLVAPLGRRETVGHPVEYGTTFQFLEYFGLGSLADLPPLGVLVDADADADDGAAEASTAAQGGDAMDSAAADGEPDRDADDGTGFGLATPIGVAPGADALAEAGATDDDGMAAAIELAPWTGAARTSGAVAAVLDPAADVPSKGRANGLAGRRRNGRAPDA